MKQAARIQRQMEEVQAHWRRAVEGTSGGGAVTATAKCDGTLTSVKIDPDAVNKDEMDLLEDMIVSAANAALEKAKEISNDELGQVTSGLKILTT